MTAERVALDKGFAESLRSPTAGWSSRRRREEPYRTGDSMSARIRRWWLVVPMSRAEQIARAPRSGADVIVLDLVEFVAEEDKPAARERVQAAIRTAQAGGAEVFAQVDPEMLVADLHACAWPGLTGVIVSRLESAQQVAEGEGLVGELEDRRGDLPR